MIRGTTPILEINLDIDASLLSVFYVTFSQCGRNVLEKTQNDCDVLGNKISVKLSQSDTLKFIDDYVEIQIRGKSILGEAVASNIMTDHVDRILKDGEI